MSKIKHICYIHYFLGLAFAKVLKSSLPEVTRTAGFTFRYITAKNVELTLSQNSVMGKVFLSRSDNHRDTSRVSATDIQLLFCHELHNSCRLQPIDVVHLITGIQSLYARLIFILCVIL